MTQIDSAKAKEYAEEIVRLAKARRVRGATPHESVEVDTVILPASRMVELRHVSEWLRFNGLDVVFTEASMSAGAEMTPSVVGIGKNTMHAALIGAPAFNVAFASSRPWNNRIRNG